ncbi:hypothetical protein [Frankia tisae]|nr:hypothetical protein [Frankia tisae]
MSTGDEQVQVHLRKLERVPNGQPAEIGGRLAKMQTRLQSVERILKDAR